MENYPASAIKQDRRSVTEKKPDRPLSSRRTSSLKEALLRSPMEISVERARIATEANREYADRPLAIRRALAYRAVLEKIPIRIYENELIVGGITEKRKGAFLFPETKNTWMGLQIDQFGERAGQPLKISPEEKRILLDDILPYWRGKSAHDQYQSSLSEETLDLQKVGAFHTEAQFIGGIFLFNPNYEKIIRGGLDTLLRDMAGPGESEFYKSAAIAGRAVINFAARYADLAEKLAIESNSTRRQELLEIAEICRRVPAQPARTFREALQSFWFVYLGLLFDDGGMEVPFGRLDQVLYPFYEADLAAGRLTRAGALELLEAFCIKASEIVFLLEDSVNLSEDGNTGRLTLTIGGMNREGLDATNDVSRLFLETIANCRTLQPNTAVRLHPGTPADFLGQVVSTMTSGGNNLQVFNDQTVVASMVEHGFSIKDSRNYIVTGCVQPAPESTYGSSCAAGINGPRTLELMISEQAQKGTLGGFDSFEAFLESYRNYLFGVTRQVISALEAADSAHELLPNPFVSLVMDGPTENGRDVKNGGTRNNITGVSLLGIANLADSLAVIKKAVFEEGKLTMVKLHELLQANFRGNEATRLHLQKGVPKFGNDEEYVDGIARDLVKALRDELHRNRTHRGGRYSFGLHSEAIHVLFGMFTGATPDGRLAGQPLAPGAGPAHGKDVSGYTASLKSMAALDPVKVVGGTSNNLRFHPDLFSNAAQVKKFEDLLAAYFFDLGGQQLQINVVSSETLKDAQQHPEKYGDLLVRISGYSARFVDLSLATQDEIIARTEHGSGSSCNL